MSRFIRTFATFLFILLALPALAAQERIALVIGNAGYPGGGQLANPVNDARAMQNALERAGFQVIKLEDAGLEDMESAILAFSKRLDKNTVGLFYYSGHGLQYDGNNYLLPIDTTDKIEAPAHLRSKAVSVDYVLASMENSGLNIVIFDACRNIPFRSFQRSVPSGLAAMNHYPDGTLIAYATAPGKVALDGLGENSPYTASLVKRMAEPLPLEQLLKKVRSDVRAETGDRQSPWYNASIEGDFYFTAPDAQGNAVAQDSPADPNMGDNDPVMADALDALDRQDYVLAAQRLLPLATQGHASAQYRLGLLYEHGLGTNQDYATARAWYEQAAAKGLATAQNKLGYLYRNGFGVARDYHKAHRFYEQAAAQGLAAAQSNLGYLYQNGLGVTLDYDKAREYYEQAAVQGLAGAQSNLGYLYQNGLGVTQDYVKAREYYEQAAAQGLADTQNALGYFYQNGLGVAQDYDKAREYYEQAAAQGLPSAQNYLGYFYQHGLGIAQDYDKARAYYEQAAAQGFAAAQSNLGYLYQNGLGVAQDDDTARAWYEKAAAQGNKIAQEALQAYQ